MREELKPEIKEGCLAFAKHMLAAGVAWKDDTTFSRDDKERIPTVFSCSIDGLRISIIAAHIYYPNQWIFNCRNLGYDEQLLKGITDAKEAAEAAVKKCRDRVNGWAKVLNACS
jgi:hypothetical protein